MIKFKNHSAKTVSELLLYLAEHDDFCSLKDLKEFNRDQVAEIFREIARELEMNQGADGLYHKADLTGFELSSKVLALISCLSPREETILFKSFRLIDR